MRTPGDYESLSHQRVQQAAAHILEAAQRDYVGKRVRGNHSSDFMNETGVVSSVEINTIGQLLLVVKLDDRIWSPVAYRHEVDFE